MADGRQGLGILRSILALLLSQCLLVGLSCPPLGRLSLIAKDQIELILVTWTLSTRLGALIACRLGLVTLSRGQSVGITLGQSPYGRRLQGTLILRVLHIWQPLEGLPQ